MRASWLRVVVPTVLFASALAVPAGAADEPPTRKELLTSQNNLKQIGLAFHAGHDHKKILPNDIYSKDGKAILSWRVALLPYIGEEKLYKEFKLDEPWDSANNKKLLAKMPKVYAPVRGKAKTGETFYQTFTGKGVLFGTDVQITIPAHMPDGTSQTALVVEASEPVIWSKPTDLPFDEKKPLPKLGGLFDGDFHVLMCDGSVLFLKKNPDEKEMKKVVIPNDGFVIDFDKLVKPVPKS